MNEDTLVVVHCYAGDREQVVNALPQYLQHGCPVLILSPEDAPVQIDHPGVECRSAGKAGYFGQDSLDRQRAHLEILAQYPQKFFLLNDSDSVCLSPEIPAYLYAHSEDVVWSNVVGEHRPHKSPYPKIAFHPPYFLAKETILRLLAVAEGVTAHEITPFIDWYMMVLTLEAGLRYEAFPDGRSFPAWRHGALPETKLLGHNYVHRPTDSGGKDGGARMTLMVERGVVMVHSVKHKHVLRALVAAHKRFAASGERLSQPPEVNDEVGDISLLVPFREDESGTRTRTWQWLERVYREVLPEAEIVIGRDDGTPYSKSIAVNDAAARATGYVFVILDADVLVDPAIIRQAATTIHKSRRAVWFVPHSRAYRLSKPRSDALLTLDPAKTVVPFGAPQPWEIEDKIDGAPGFVQILSRRAFEKVGGYDQRYRGWGGEDGSFVNAVDTLYGKHTRLPGHVLHLWHERPGAGRASDRSWDGGLAYKDNTETQELRRRYRFATGDRTAMRALVNGGIPTKESQMAEHPAPTECEATLAMPGWDPAPNEGGATWPEHVYHCALPPGHLSDHQTANGRARWV